MNWQSLKFSVYLVINELNILFYFKHKIKRVLRKVKNASFTGTFRKTCCSGISLHFEPELQLMLTTLSLQQKGLSECQLTKL